MLFFKNQSKAFLVTNHRHPITIICNLLAFAKSNCCLEKLGNTILFSFAKNLKICFFILQR